MMVPRPSWNCQMSCISLYMNWKLMFTVSFYRPIDLCFLFVLLDILCRAFEWIGMIWYKLIHRFAKLEEQQFSNTSRFAKQKRQNQTKDDKSTFFSRCSFQMFFPDKGPSDMKNQSRHVVSVVCATSICSFWWRCVVSPFAAVFSCLQKCSFLIYIYIHSMYLFRFLVFYIWININETCFRTCFSKDKGGL